MSTDLVLHTRIIGTSPYRELSRVEVRFEFVTGKFGNGPWLRLYWRTSSSAMWERQRTILVSGWTLPAIIFLNERYAPDTGIAFTDVDEVTFNIWRDSLLLGL